LNASRPRFSRLSLTWQIGWLQYARIHALAIIDEREWEAARTAALYGTHANTDVQDMINRALAIE
jgi:hypothetical protein